MVKVGDHARVFEVAQPLLFLGGQLLARPMHGVGGVGIETFERVVGGAVFVVVALDAGNVHVADDLETFFWVGVVADDIAEADDRAWRFGVLMSSKTTWKASRLP